MNTDTTEQVQCAGRKTKFTPETRARLIDLIAKGVPFGHASAAAGISYQSFLNYRRDHEDFQAEIESAVALAIEKRLKIIEKAADSGDVRAAAWMLQHLHPNLFSRSRIEISGPDGAPLTAAIAVYLPQKDGSPLAVTTDIKEIEDGNED